MAELELQMMWPEEDWITVRNKYSHQLVSIPNPSSFESNLTMMISIS
jgi:hypothetical protein